MPDLDERFRSTDRIDAPDLWPEIRVRVRRPEVRPLETGGIDAGSPPRIQRRWGFVAVAAALVVVVIAVGLVLRSVRSGPNPAPATSPPRPGAIGVPFNPGAVTIGRSGTIYLSDCQHSRVYAVVNTDPPTVSVVGGDGAFSFYGGLSGDHGPATQAAIDCPSGLVESVDGSLIFADSYNNRLRAIAVDGTIASVMGRGPVGIGYKGPVKGDGGPMADAIVRMPGGLAFDADGNLLVADRGDHAIRSVTPDGVVSTVAGTGKPGYSGDGKQAVLATFRAPNYVLPDDRGGFYVSDGDAHVVRYVDAQGVVRTVAGTGAERSSGDGRPAVDAGMLEPQGLALDGRGNLSIADTSAHVIRQVGPDGTISTIAGTGRGGCPRDGAVATASRFQNPSGLALYQGSLYVADSGCGLLSIDPAGFVHVIVPVGDLHADMATIGGLPTP